MTFLTSCTQLTVHRYVLPELASHISVDNLTLFLLQAAVPDGCLTFPCASRHISCSFGLGQRSRGIGTLIRQKASDAKIGDSKRKTEIADAEGLLRHWMGWDSYESPDGNASKPCHSSYTRSSTDALTGYDPWFAASTSHLYFLLSKHPSWHLQSNCALFLASIHRSRSSYLRSGPSVCC